MTTQAVIICGGLGTRLGSLVKDTPKPMLPVGGRPVLDHTIEALRHHGITRIVLAAGYKAEVVEQHFARRSDWGLDVRVSIEPAPLGTAGPLSLLRTQLDEQFLVLYGDEFLDLDVRRFIDAHESVDALVTMLVRPSTHPWNADLIQTRSDGTVSEI